MVDTTIPTLMEAFCNSFNQELSFHDLYLLFAWVVYLPSMTSKKHSYIITQKYRAMVGAHKRAIIHEQLSISTTTIS
jgi:hypothetical protein